MANAGKEIIEARTHELQQRGLNKQKAYSQACKENPNAVKDMVVSHNVAHGRLKAAKLFAERFED